MEQFTTTLKSIGAFILRPGEAFFSIADRFHWFYLLSSIFVAYVLLLRARRRGLSLKLVSTNIFRLFTHPSARLDYAYVWVNRMFFPILYAPLFYASTEIALYIGRILPPQSPAHAVEPTVLSTLLFSAVIVISYDFGVFLAHYLAHRIPLLWEFHKVHHSAEVLTPVTVYRMHPVDDIWTLSISNVCSGLATGVTLWMLPLSGAAYMIGGLNIFLFIFYVVGFHLRHSPVWLSYGPTLSKIFISPAQHQIHHSADRKHFDRNFGFMFAIWDWAFGSLYVPQSYEQLTLGLPPDECRSLRSVPQLYLTPFRNALKILRNMLRFGPRPEA